MADPTTDPAPEEVEPPHGDLVRAAQMREAREPLAHRIAFVAGSVARLPKTAEVTGEGPRYRYTPVEDMAAAITRLCAAAGIALIPVEVEPLLFGALAPDGRAWDDLTGSGQGKVGRKSVYLYRVRWEVTDGTTTLSVTSMGEAADWGDKGSNKALTSARKYLYTMLFHLQTGDDPDATHPTDPEGGRQQRKGGGQSDRKPANDAVVARKAEVLRAVGGDEKEALAFLRRNDCGSFGALKYPKVWETVREALTVLAEAGPPPAGASPAAAGPQPQADVSPEVVVERYALVVSRFDGNEDEAKDFMREQGVRARSGLGFNPLWKKVAAAAGLDDGLDG